MGIIGRVQQAKKRTAIEKDEDCFRIGILGAARIAPDAIIYPAGKLKSCMIYAVAARNPKKSEKFAKKHKIPNVFQSYEELIESDEIDIVFNPLPNGYHAYYSILALKAGKHVLCEKPLASNEKEVDQIIAAQEQAPLNKKTGTKPMIFSAYHYRHHPVTQKIRDMVLNDEIGDVTDFEIKLSIPGIAVPKSDIRFNASGTNSELAGGSLMDLGCYAVSMFRLFAETSLTKDLTTLPQFEVIESKIKEAFSSEDKKGIDQKCETTVEMFLEDDPEGRRVRGKLFTNFKGWGISMYYKVKGTKKELTMTNPLLPFAYHKVVEKDLKTNKKSSWKEYGEGYSTYYYQLSNFIAAIKGDEEALATCNWAGGLAVAKQDMAIIDAIYTKAGAEPRVGKDCTSILE